jgi:MoxR-like ATPase
MKKRVQEIIKTLTSGLYERDKEVKLALLGALSGENIFLYGPPGVAKSLISRRVAKAFEGGSYFEYLMQKFSTPEDVFGPIMLSELKKDNFVRKIDGYLPSADIAFLDEIFKASPSILNTLLTIINEKVFKNGNEIVKVPLKALFAASNEIPENEGLEALYDRFLIRLIVNPIKKRENFEAMLQGGEASAEIEISNKFTNEELEKFRKEIKKVKISQDTLNLIHAIRIEIEKYNQTAKNPIYVSDRRWQKAGKLLKASAYFNGRNETNIVDVSLLKYCLWEVEEDFEVVKNIVENVIKDVGIDVGVNLLEIKKEKEELERDIDEVLFYEDYIYENEVVEIEGEEYFKIYPKFYYYHNSDENNYSILYINLKNIGNNNWFDVLDNEKNKTEWIKAKWDNKKFIIVLNRRHDNSQWDNLKQNKIGDEYYWSVYSFILKFKTNYYQRISPHKVFFKKDNVNKRVLQALKEDVDEIKERLFNALNQAKNKRQELIKNLSNVFLEDKETEIAPTSVNKQIEDIELEIKDLERIYNKIKEFENA